MEEALAVCQVVRDDSGEVIDLTYLAFNTAHERQTGLDGRTMIGRKLSEVLTKSDVERFIPIYARVANTGEPANFEEYVDFTDRWYAASVYPQGKELSIFYRDITERKRHEQQREYLLRLNDALRSIADPVEIQKVATRVLGEHLNVDRAIYAEINIDEDWFEAIDNYTSKSVQKVIGRFPFSAFGPPGEKLKKGESLVIHNVSAEVDEPSQKAFHAIDVHAVVAVPLIKKGRLVAELSVHQTKPRHWLDHEVALLYETAERTWAAVERAKAEETLRKSEAHLAATFEALPVGISVVDAQGKIILYNSAMKRFLPEGIIPSRNKSASGRWRAFNSDGTLLSPDNYPGARALRGESVIPGIEFLFRETDNSEIWTLVSAVPVRDEHGNVIEAMDLVTDINNRKQAEKALQELNENLEKTVQVRTKQLSKLKIGQEKERLNAVLLGQEMERTRIGEGLHNGVAQLLFASKSMLQSVYPTTENEKKAFSSALSILADAIKDTRNISFELMPPVLRDYGLEPAIEKFINKIFTSDLQIRLSVNLKKRLSESLEISIYRITQEIVSNIRKHSRATVAVIEISETPKNIILRSKDNGSSFIVKDVVKRQSGMGLQNIENRVKLLEGKMKIESQPGHDTVIEIQLPVIQKT